MEYAFLFPGQGAQKPGMMADLCDKFTVAKDIVTKVTDISGIDIAKLLWNSDQATLSRSDNSQVAIMTSSLIVMAVLKEKGVTPSASMGFSLGEFPALYAAGVLTLEDLIKTVVTRGKIMQKVCEEIASENSGHAPGMMAVLGLPPQKVIEIAKTVPDAYPSNMNSVKQTVVSGTFDALEKLEPLYKDAGARRCVKLAVAGPFHSPLMQKAADEFQAVVDNLKISEPNIALFSNVTGNIVKTSDEVRKNMTAHITHGVQWTSEEESLTKIIKDSGKDWKILEVGVGQVLTGLWKNTDYGLQNPCTAIGDAESFEKL